MDNLKTIHNVCPECDEIICVKVEIVDNIFESKCPLCRYVWKEKIQDEV